MRAENYKQLKSISHDKINKASYSLREIREKDKKAALQVLKTAQKMSKQQTDKFTD